VKRTKPEGSGISLVMTIESAVAPAPRDITAGGHRKWRRVHGLQVSGQI